jgi:DNA replication protein
MKGFIGFSDGPSAMTPLPDAFFLELLPQIDHLGEGKLTLLMMWRLAQTKGRYRFLTGSSIRQDPDILRTVPLAALADALERAVARGTFLLVNQKGANSEQYYFLNSQRGRAAAQGLEEGKWSPAGEQPAELPQAQRPNIFVLYEQNIGPLTPLIADLLRNAAEQYSDQEVTIAIRAAVEQNARSWRYVEAVLEGRSSEGRESRAEPDAEERKKYVEGKYSDFIEH